MATKIFGPWSYRRFMRWADRFLRVMPWLFFAGIVVFIAMSLLDADERYGAILNVVCALTIWPAIIGWLAISGLGILWKFVLSASQTVDRKQRLSTPSLIWALTVLLVGVAFLGGAVALLSVLVGQAF